eukprot:361365-Chlamydomonas_euryale.AAC.9
MSAGGESIWRGHVGLAAACVLHRRQRIPPDDARRSGAGHPGKQLPGHPPIWCSLRCPRALHTRGTGYPVVGATHKLADAQHRHLVVCVCGRGRTSGPRLRLQTTLSTLEAFDLSLARIFHVRHEYGSATLRLIPAPDRRANMWSFLVWFDDGSSAVFHTIWLATRLEPALRHCLIL